MHGPRHACNIAQAASCQAGVASAMHDSSLWPVVGWAYSPPSASELLQQRAARTLHASTAWMDATTMAPLIVAAGHQVGLPRQHRAGGGQHERAGRHHRGATVWRGAGNHGPAGVVWSEGGTGFTVQCAGTHACMHVFMPRGMREGALWWQPLRLMRWLRAVRRPLHAFGNEGRRLDG